MRNNFSNKIKQDQSGNILLIILLAIALIGALTIALQGSGQQNATIDKEALALRVSEIQRYASELEQAVSLVIQNGHGEQDIRFAYADANPSYGDLTTDTDKSDQVFDRAGGAAVYRLPPMGLNDGSTWEFYGNTNLPDVGTEAAELLAVLPNVSQAFCEAMNDTIGYETGVQPEDSGICLHSGIEAYYREGTYFSSAPNTVDDITFTHKPSMQGCAKCDDGKYHFFSVLLTR